MLNMHTVCHCQFPLLAIQVNVHVEWISVLLWIYCVVIGAERALIVEEWSKKSFGYCNSGSWSMSTIWFNEWFRKHYSSDISPITGVEFLEIVRNSYAAYSWCYIYNSRCFFFSSPRFHVRAFHVHDVRYSHSRWIDARRSIYHRGAPSYKFVLLHFVYN